MKTGSNECGQFEFARERAILETKIALAREAELEKNTSHDPAAEWFRIVLLGPELALLTGPSPGPGLAPAGRTSVEPGGASSLSDRRWLVGRQFAVVCGKRQKGGRQLANWYGVVGRFFFSVAGLRQVRKERRQMTGIRKSADGSAPPHQHRPCATSQLLRHAGAHVEPLICADKKRATRKMLGQVAMPNSAGPPKTSSVWVNTGRQARQKCAQCLRGDWGSTMSTALAGAFSATIQLSRKSAHNDCGCSPNTRNVLNKRTKPHVKHCPVNKQTNAE